MMRGSEVIRGWLGWCPNGHTMNVRTQDTGYGGSAGCLAVKSPGAPGREGNGAPDRGKYEHTQRGTLIIGAVSAAIVLLSAGALHPMLSAVIVGASLGPAQLGLPVLPHLSAVLVGWSLAIIVTPFSVVSTLASRWSGIPVLAISFRANAVFVLLALASSAGLLGLLARLIKT